MNKEDRWLAAVSAGPDSMALLDMCLKKGIPTAVGHVNYHHQIQAEEEEEYLRAYCTAHGIPLFVRNEEFVHAGNFEADARTWRYDFLSEVVKENHFQGILTAHQEDDLLETYLMQKERHLVPQWYGLRKEIQYHGVRVVRPLLGWTKKDLEEYCEKQHIRYYVDETNGDESLARNRIRHEVVEKLSDEERRSLKAEIDARNAKMERIRRRADEVTANGAVLLEAYRKEEEEVRLAALRSMLDPDMQKHLTLGFIRETDAVIRSRRDFMIPFGSERIVTKDGKMFLYHPGEPYVHVYAKAEDLKYGKYGFYEIKEGKPSVNAVTLYPEDYPLTIRSVRPADSVQMRYGRKSASRFFVDRKIPQFERKTWPVVVNRQNEIILIPGLGCSPAHYSTLPTVNVVQYTQIEENEGLCGKKRT